MNSLRFFLRSCKIAASYYLARLGSKRAVRWLLAAFFQYEESNRMMAGILLVRLGRRASWVVREIERVIAGADEATREDVGHLLASMKDE